MDRIQIKLEAKYNDPKNKSKDPTAPTRSPRDPPAEFFDKDGKGKGRSSSTSGVSPAARLGADGGWAKGEKPSKSAEAPAEGEEDPEKKKTSKGGSGAKAARAEKRKAAFATTVANSIRVG